MIRWYNVLNILFALMAISIALLALHRGVVESERARWLPVHAPVAMNRLLRSEELAGSTWRRESVLTNYQLWSDFSSPSVYLDYNEELHAYGDYPVMCRATRYDGRPWVKLLWPEHPLRLPYLTNLYCWSNWRVQ